MPEHNDWLRFAEDDLFIAQVVLKCDEVRIPPILYHCQQAGEKALKAYLVFRGQKPERTHDLTRLLELCVDFDDEFISLLPQARELTPFVTKARYPDSAFVIPSVSVAEHAVQQAQTIMDFVYNKVD